MLLGVYQNLVRQRVKGIADIALGSGKLLHLIAGQVPPDGQNGQSATHRLGQRCRDLGGVLGTARTIRGKQEVLHDWSPKLIGWEAKHERSLIGSDPGQPV
jgi:hypothetical protein